MNTSIRVKGSPVQSLIPVSRYWSVPLKSSWLLPLAAAAIISLL
nr:MAG TPA_asm: hypothetical protein [Bacteriophage sp.]